MATATRTPSLSALRTPAQRIAAVAIVLGFLVLVAAVVTGNQAQQRIWEDLPDCQGSSTSDCVQVQDGRFVVRTQNDKEVVYFYPEGESGRDKVSLDARHLRGGAKATAEAVYLGDDVIAIQDRDGDRHWRNGTLDVPAWYLLGFAGGLVLILGGVGAFLRSAVRR